MRRCIQICHSDDTLIAEMAFWSASADMSWPAERQSRPAARKPERHCRKYSRADRQQRRRSRPDRGAVEARARESHSITKLDNKTIASVRRLFQEKSVEAILLSQSDFTTRQLAELLKSKESQPRWTAKCLRGRLPTVTSSFTTNPRCRSARASGITGRSALPHSTPQAWNGLSGQFYSAGGSP